MTGSSNRASRDKYEKLTDNIAIYSRNRKWYANIQLHGKQIRRSLKTTSKKQARLNAMALARQYENGMAPHRKPKATIEEVFAAFICWKEGEGLAERTLSKYQFAIGFASRLAVDLKRKYVHQIDPGFMDRYRAARRERGSAPKTISVDLVILRGAVKFAISRKFINEDPLAGYQIRKPKPTPQPCWSAEEMGQIIATAKRLPHRDVFAVLADTGMRVGELVHLTWDDFDIERNVLHIRPKNGWKPKTGDIRAIPMTRRVTDLIQAQPKRSQWIFTFPRSPRGHDEGRQVSARRLLDYLKRVLKRLELKGHLHTFRHYHISLAIDRKVTTPVLRSWVGHVDPKTLDLYTHIASSTAQEAIRAIENAPQDTSVRTAHRSPEVESKSSTILAHTKEPEACA